MITTMTEQTTDLVVKGGLVGAAWVFAQVKPLADLGIQQAFDQLFSLGLLMLFLVYMIYENKKKDKKHDQGQQAYVDLIQQNSEVIRDFAESNKDVAKSVERSQQQQTQVLESLTRVIERLDNRVNNNQ